MQHQTSLGMTIAVVALGLALGLMLGCGQTPYRAFAVEVASAPPPPDPVAPPAPAGLAAASSGLRTAGLTTGADSGLRARHPQWDLNRVSPTTLATLPGIDANTVAAIVGGRPYKAKRELLRRKILTAAQYARWKDYLVVHRTATKAAD